MNVDELLPLSPPMYAVLLTLKSSAMHGYRIIQEFEEASGQEGVLLPGSLYNTISRMLNQGMLEEVPPPAHEQDGRRRYYRATELGKAACAAESSRLRILLGMADEAPAT